MPRAHGPDQHPDAPGLFFLGYTNAVSGNLRDIAIRARRLARRIAAARVGLTPARYRGTMRAR